MLTVNGVRMSKSAGNGFLPHELFTGNHPLLDKGYSPMAVRFFMMQTHYRSTLDFSNEALQAAEKGFSKLMTAIKTLKKLKPAATSTSDIKALTEACYAAMNDDFNSPVLIANLFEAVRIINSVNDGKESITAEDLKQLEITVNTFVFEVMGLHNEADNNNGGKALDTVMQIVLEQRAEAKKRKDFATSDQIRDLLLAGGITIKDTKEGTLWQVD
jgi:cysteinyl-tRNA synthetase